MKSVRYERTASGITKVSSGEHGDYCWQPMSWNGLHEYVDWLIANIDNEDLNRWSSESVRDQTLDMLQQAKQKIKGES